MFQKSWFSAEQMLQKAAKWIFIGYSMPAADFEFKYLLKRVQLSGASSPKIIVVTGGQDQEEISRTYSNYQRFFGRSIKRRVTFFEHGLASDATDAIKQ